jgi:hypothetical protein
LNYSEFKCKWIDPVSLWDIAHGTRKKYWPESKLPVSTEEIVEFRLRLNIEPVKNLLSTVDIDAYLKRDLSGIVVDYDCYMNDKFANRMRFSFAHELGHFFLDTCIKLQYKRFNSKFFVSGHGDKTTCIDKTPSRNPKFY